MDAGRAAWKYLYRASGESAKRKLKKDVHKSMDLINRKDASGNLPSPARELDRLGGVGRTEECDVVVPFRSG
jgi:hypothetical protein